MNAKEAKKRAYLNKLEIIKQYILSAVNQGLERVTVNKSYYTPSAKIWLENSGYTTINLDYTQTIDILWENPNE